MSKKKTTEDYVASYMAHTNPQFFAGVKIRKTTTYRLTEADQEKGDPLSMTIPDQSMEMREIYRRYATGRPIDQSNREPIFLGEEEIPDMKKLDLVEIGELLQEQRERVENLKTKLVEEQENANRLEAEKAQKAREEEDKRLLDLVYKERKSLLDQK